MDTKMSTSTSVLPSTTSKEDAWALLSLQASTSSVKRPALARLQGKEFEYLVRERRLVIGRNSSSNGSVDINLGHSTFVSRRHVEIVYDDQVGHFQLFCHGKNGLFVDNAFHRKGALPIILHKTCSIRFPSTNIRLCFESLIDDVDLIRSIEVPTEDGRSMQPLAISIPTALNSQIQLQSPISPTGTISVANSCPSSPSGRILPPMNSGALRPIVTSGKNDTKSNSSFDPSNPVIFPPEDRGQQQGASTLNIEQGTKQALLTSTGKKERTQTPKKDASASGVSSNTPSGQAEPKPPYSYAQLIVQSIASSPEKQLTLSGIYAFITSNYPYYRNADKGWQNSIRHNLSLNRYFVKVPRSQEEPGKGSFWKIEDGSESKLIDQAFRRRRQRGNFRPSTTSSSGTLISSNSQSAPSSPTHVTVAGLMTPDSLSRDSSPRPIVSNEEKAISNDKGANASTAQQQPQTKVVVAGKASGQQTVAIMGKSPSNDRAPLTASVEDLKGSGKGEVKKAAPVVSTNPAPVVLQLASLPNQPTLALPNVVTTAPKANSVMPEESVVVASETTLGKSEDGATIEDYKDKKEADATVVDTNEKNDEPSAKKQRTDEDKDETKSALTSNKALGNGQSKTIDT